MDITTLALILILSFLSLALVTLSGRVFIQLAALILSHTSKVVVSEKEGSPVQTTLSEGTEQDGKSVLAITSHTTLDKAD